MFNSIEFKMFFLFLATITSCQSITDNLVVVLQLGDEVDQVGTWQCLLAIEKCHELLQNKRYSLQVSQKNATWSFIIIEQQQEFINGSIVLVVNQEIYRLYLYQNQSLFAQFQISGKTMSNKQDNFEINLSFEDPNLTPIEIYILFEWITILVIFLQIPLRYYYLSGYFNKNLKDFSLAAYFFGYFQQIIFIPSFSIYQNDYIVSFVFLLIAYILGILLNSLKIKKNEIQNDNDSKIDINIWVGIFLIISFLYQLITFDCWAFGKNLYTEVTMRINFFLFLLPLIFQIRYYNSYFDSKSNINYICQLISILPSPIYSIILQWTSFEIFGISCLKGLNYFYLSLFILLLICLFIQYFQPKFLKKIYKYVQKKWHKKQQHQIDPIEEQDSSLSKKLTQDNLILFEQEQMKKAVKPRRNNDYQQEEKVVSEANYPAFEKKTEQNTQKQQSVSRIRDQVKLEKFSDSIITVKENDAHQAQKFSYPKFEEEAELQKANNKNPRPIKIREVKKSQKEQPKPTDDSPNYINTWDVQVYNLKQQNAPKIKDENHIKIWEVQAHSITPQQQNKQNKNTEQQERNFFYDFG